MEIQKGYLFITDITGYTQFLTRSELDHAKEILDALFDSILHHLNPPIVISGTQGDAIVTYFPEDAFTQPQSIVEEMEHIYYDFQHQLSLMKFNTTCTCNACANMAALDLKIFLHYGQYMLQQIGDKVDLQGADVILIHRLMKNQVKEKFGVTGYGLITEAAVDALGIAGLTDGMHPHTEGVEHFNDVHMYIYDLRKAWEARQKTDRQLLTPENAFVWAEAFVPIPQWMAWDLSLRDDVKQRIFFVDDIVHEGDPGARLSSGSEFHCVHHEGDVDFLVLDLDAPNTITSRNTNLVMDINYLFGFNLRPVEGGTIFTVLYGPPNIEITEELKALFQPYADNTAREFAQFVDEEIAAGRIQPEQFKELAGKKNEYRRPGVDQGRFATLAGENI